MPIPFLHVDTKTVVVDGLKDKIDPRFMSKVERLRALIKGKARVMSTRNERKGVIRELDGTGYAALVEEVVKKMNLEGGKLVFQDIFETVTEKTAKSVCQGIIDEWMKKISTVAEELPVDDGELDRKLNSLNSESLMWLRGEVVDNGDETAVHRELLQQKSISESRKACDALWHEYENLIASATLATFDSAFQQITNDISVRAKGAAKDALSRRIAEDGTRRRERFVAEARKEADKLLEQVKNDWSRSVSLIKRALPQGQKEVRQSLLNAEEEGCNLLATTIFGMGPIDPHEYLNKFKGVSSAGITDVLTLNKHFLDSKLRGLLEDFNVKAQDLSVDAYEESFSLLKQRYLEENNSLGSAAAILGEKIEQLKPQLRKTAEDKRQAETNRKRLESLVMLDRFQNELRHRLEDVAQQTGDTEKSRLKTILAQIQMEYVEKLKLQLQAINASPPVIDEALGTLNGTFHSRAELIPTDTQRKWEQKKLDNVFEEFLEQFEMMSLSGFEQEFADAKKSALNNAGALPTDALIRRIDKEKATLRQQLEAKIAMQVQKAMARYQDIEAEWEVALGEEVNKWHLPVPEKDLDITTSTLIANFVDKIRNVMEPLNSDDLLRKQIAKFKVSDSLILQSPTSKDLTIRAQKDTAGGVEELKRKNRVTLQEKIDQEIAQARAAAVTKWSQISVTWRVELGAKARAKQSVQSSIGVVRGIDLAAEFLIQLETFAGPLESEVTKRNAEASQSLCNRLHSRFAEEVKRFTTSEALEANIEDTWTRIVSEARGPAKDQFYEKMKRTLYDYRIEVRRVGDTSKVERCRTIISRYSDTMGNLRSELPLDESTLATKMSTIGISSAREPESITSTISDIMHAKYVSKNYQVYNCPGKRSVCVEALSPSPPHDLQRTKSECENSLQAMNQQKSDELCDNLLDAFFAHMEQISDFDGAMNAYHWTSQHFLQQARGPGRAELQAAMLDYYENMREKYSSGSESPDNEQPQVQYYQPARAPPHSRRPAGRGRTTWVKPHTRANGTRVRGHHRRID
ncbi:hypothetical protein HK104_009153 [Borealophlyctis nickersoniae]|nr:hypothetical protein HK104_009153 [Borealophlyctis nickersoniae]